MKDKPIFGCINCANRIKNNYYPHDYGKCKLDGLTISFATKTCNKFILKTDGILFSKTNIILE